MVQFPDSYVNAMKALLTEEGFLSYAETFDRPYHQGLRVNTSKISVPEFLARWEEKTGEVLTPVPWCDCGFYLSQDTTVYSKDPDYYAGLYYLQEPSAMAPAAVLPIQAGDRVLDLCAAPGGKSTYLASKLKGTGLLVSNDISPSRAKALLKNLELFGTANMAVISEAPYKLSQRFPIAFNKILVDAPCSGEGMFHKEPAIMKNWEQYGNEYYAKLQREILESAYQLLEVGGQMVYSTCTFAPLEDEQMMAEFLTKHPDMHLMPITKVGGMEDGHPEWISEGQRERLTAAQGPAGTKPEDLTFCARFWPHKAKGQGHYVALLKKDSHGVESTGSTKENHLPRIFADRDRRGGFSAEDLVLFTSWAEETLVKPWQEVLPDDGILSKLGTSLYYSPIPQGALSGLRVLRCGLLLGELKKDRFEPSTALALTLRQGDVQREVSFRTGEDGLIRYLKGESLTGLSQDISDGWALVLDQGIPVGWGKMVHGQLKNKYLKGWKLS